MIKQFAIFTFALLIGAPLAFAEELRPVTHEDIWQMKRLGAPVVSPDGALAVLSVTEPSYEKDETVSDLWLVPVDGSEPPRRLTATPSGESGVDWRPDGGAIAFSAKRGDDEQAQIYVLDMSGPGEAQRITDFSEGAASPKWSPDGSMIAFESTVWPDAEGSEANAERSKTDKEDGINASRYDHFPVRNWDHWRSQKQKRLFVQDARPGAEARDLMFGSELVSGPGYEGGLSAVWTPQGDALVVTATVNLHEAAHSVVQRHLYRVPLSGDAISAVTAGEDFGCSSARFSRDGTALYCRYTPVNDHVYNHSEIARADWAGSANAGELELLTADFDRSVGSYDLSLDDETIYLSAAEHGRVRLFALPAGGGEIRHLDADSRGVYGTVQAGNGGLLAVWESSAAAAELVRIDPHNGAHAALSEFNAERLDGLDRPAFREFWFTSSKGREIHSWLALPPDFDETQRYPLVLFIHGGPFSSSMDTDHVRWSPHLIAAAGYVVLMTDYTGSVGYGAEFSRNIEGDPLATPGEELIEAMDAAIARYDFIDPDRLAASGASYGGHLVNWLLGTSDRFDVLVGHAGLVDLEGQWATSDVIYHRERMNSGPPWGESTVWREQSPSSYVEHFATPTMLTIGEKDYRVPLNQTLAAWAYLQRMQVPSRLLVFHDANHWIMNGKEARYFWEEVHAWLAEYLKDD